MRSMLLLGSIGLDFGRIASSLGPAETLLSCDQIIRQVQKFTIGVLALRS